MHWDALNRYTSNKAKWVDIQKNVGVFCRSEADRKLFLPVAERCTSQVSPQVADFCVSRETNTSFHRKSCKSRLFFPRTPTACKINKLITIWDSVEQRRRIKEPNKIEFLRNGEVFKINKQASMLQFHFRSLFYPSHCVFFSFFLICHWKCLQFQKLLNRRSASKCLESKGDDFDAEAVYILTRIGL